MSALAKLKASVVADLGFVGKLPGVAVAIEKAVHAAILKYAPGAMPILMLADQFAHKGETLLPEPSRLLLDELLHVCDEVLADQPPASAT